MTKILAKQVKGLYSMKRLGLILIMVIILALLSGCAQIEYDMTVGKDLGGTCSVKVLPFAPIPMEEIRKDLVQKGIKNFTIDPYQEAVDLGNGQKQPVNGFLIKTSWKTTDELKQMLVAINGRSIDNPLLKNEDGTVSMNLGNLGAYKTRIRVDGTIDPQSTKGKLLDSNYIEFFASQPVAFNYKPSSGVPIQIIIIGMCLLAALGASYFYIKNNLQSK